MVMGDGNTRPQKIPINKVKDHKTHKETGGPEPAVNNSIETAHTSGTEKVVNSLQCLKKSKRVWGLGSHFPSALNQPSALCSEVLELEPCPLISPQAAAFLSGSLSTGA